MALVIDRRGFRDWIAQRITAILIGVYTVFILVYLFAHPDLSYQEWRGLFHNILVRIFTIVVTFCVLWHAWIGIWTVLTDYVKCKAIRTIIEFCVLLFLFGSLILVGQIFWG